jgi:hypothetical protein
VCECVCVCVCVCVRVMFKVCVICHSFDLAFVFNVM